MAIAEEVLFLNDIRSTIREHTTNVKSEVRRHKIKKYSDLIASQCISIYNISEYRLLLQIMTSYLHNYESYYAVSYA